MTDEQKAAWDAQYEPENQDFIRRMKAGELDDKDVLRGSTSVTSRTTCVAFRQSTTASVACSTTWTKRSLADDTIVIYSSDQGFYLGEHGWYDKRWMFEESLKMPFLIRWPGVINPGIELDRADPEHRLRADLSGRRRR